MGCPALAKEYDCRVTIQQQILLRILDYEKHSIEHPVLAI